MFEEPASKPGTTAPDYGAACPPAGYPLISDANKAHTPQWPRMQRKQQGQQRESEAPGE
jgi:hypothetical protein